MEIFMRNKECQELVNSLFKGCQIHSEVVFFLSGPSPTNIGPLIQKDF